jgi:hypothetical protein
LGTAERDAAGTNCNHSQLLADVLWSMDKDRFGSRPWKNGFETIGLWLFVRVRGIESMRVERRDQARIASTSGLTPKIWIILFML